MKALPRSAVERDQFLAQVEAATAPVAHGHCAAVTDHLRRLLDAFAAERIGPHHFSGPTGAAHGDPGREAVDRVFARVMQAEAAAVRLQFVSGTHAIAAALFGVLRPGDTLLAAAGRPYETLEQVIGLGGKGQGSLQEFCVAY
ncbi:MAG: aluminum resistance family protein, partial [Synechococcus sp. SB0665_bin_28]|nr:aluminum resistance family protein [Synechococcus sp. SB0665_bin_28]